MRAHSIRAILLLALAAGALVLAGCSEEPGTPSATDNPVGNGQPTATTTEPASNLLDAIVACDLLSAHDLSQFDVTEPGEDKGALAGSDTSACGWGRSSTAERDGVAFSIAVRPNQGIDSVVVQADETIEDGNFEGRPARMLREEREAGASCMLSLALGDRSRVDISANGGGRSHEAGKSRIDVICDTVNKIATIVEPKLPKDGGS